MPKLNEYLTVGEAAEYLGVSPNTLRNWGRDGKVNERRHPVNDYRLYAIEELNQLLASIEGEQTDATKVKKAK